MRSAMIVVALLAFRVADAPAIADDKPTAKPPAGQTKRVLVEQSKRTEFRGFASNLYEPTTAEAKAAEPGVIENEHAVFDATKADVLTGKTGKRIAWFGIVREIAVDKKANATRWLVEMKYFDGIVDAHIQLASIYSAGDFTVSLPGEGYEVKPLSLVRVIGVVEKDEKGVPHVKAEYVRNWDWGHFSFMDYGKEAGNPKWAKLRQVSGDDVYHPNPNDEYYEQRLGKRPEAKEKK
jgi:hypothetical protein